MWKNKNILEACSFTSQEVGPIFPDEQKLHVVIHISPQQPKVAEPAGPSGSLDPTVRYSARWLSCECSFSLVILLFSGQVISARIFKVPSSPEWRSADYGLSVRSE